MSKDLWLPINYELPDGSKTRLLLFSGADWQIFDTTGANNLLLAFPELVQKWCAAGFLEESLFGEIVFGDKSYGVLESDKKYMLIPVESGQGPENKIDALSFALALKESRKFSKEVSFHDAIYVEQFTRLLPTWTLTPHVEDEVVLGTWLTGGVVISTDSFRRLANLTGWMPTDNLADIIKAAGFDVPADAGLLTKQSPASQARTEGKATMSKEAADVGSELGQSQEKPGVAKIFKLPGRPQLEEFFNEHVIDIIFNAEKYRALGIEFPSAIVLHGPPGCGKTFAVERLVEFIDWPSFSINSNSVGSPYIHETSKKISEIFDKALDAAPSVIIIDEMESFLSERGAGGSSGLYHVEEVAEFLRRIPEAIENKVLIIAMTNMIEAIDPAILRRGRFDHIVEVGMPSSDEVKSLLDTLLARIPTNDAIDISPLVETLTGKPLSDIAFVVREAARIAAKAGKSQIDQDSITSALASLPQDKEKKEKRIGF